MQANLISHQLAAPSISAIMQQKPFPEFVYKIVDVAPPSPIPLSLPLSTLDAKDGFIHLSVADQIPITADLFFSSNNSLWVLKIDSAKAEEEKGRLTWAPTDGCVHLYGEKEGTWARLGEGTVVSTKQYNRTSGQKWWDVMQEPHGVRWRVDHY